VPRPGLAIDLLIWWFLAVVAKYEAGGAYIYRRETVRVVRLFEVWKIRF
jgi:hypothetical protein